MESPIKKRRRSKDSTTLGPVSSPYRNIRSLLFILLCWTEIACSGAVSASSISFLRDEPDESSSVAILVPRLPRRAQAYRDSGNDNFASCADGQDDHVCNHGGVCRPIVEDDQYHCDCSTARDGDGTVYVGKWCHLPPQVLCDEAGHFCVNDGTCKDDQTCECGEDFVGIHCEYHKGDSTVTTDDLQGGHAGGTGNTNDEAGTGQQGDDCPLQCQNGGTCEWEKGSSSLAPHCNCLDGYDGDLCEGFQDILTPCGAGGQSCHHGSSCVKTLSGEYACDCTTATIPGSNATTPSDRRFAGRWCQYEASSYCDADRRYYCANGGTCVQSSADDGGVFSCQCDDAQWTGPSCEFEVANQTADIEYENCTLTCLNGGQCRKGAKEDSASSEGDGATTTKTPSTSVFDDNFEHCACPEGYTGLVCEHRYEICGNGEHFCLHGSKCVRSHEDGANVSRSQWTCDCEEAFRDDGNYVGPFCQHHHTMLCTTEDSGKDVYNPSTSLAFCVNDGVCTEVMESGMVRPACSCPAGYTGAHCELLEPTQAAIRGATTGGGADEGSNETNANSVVIIVVCFVLGILLAVLWIILCRRWKRVLRSRTQRGRDGIMLGPKHLEEGDANRTQSAIMREDPDFDPDFDERDLEEVELL